MFLVVLASIELFFHLLFAEIKYTITIFNINQCMVELWYFLPKGLQAFLIQLFLVLFQFKRSDISLCRREEVAPCFLWILFSSKLPLQKKAAHGYLLEILLHAFQFASHSDEGRVSRHIAASCSVFHRLWRYRLQKTLTDLLQCLSTYPQAFNFSPLQSILHLPL